MYKLPRPMKIGELAERAEQALRSGLELLGGPPELLPPLELLGDRDVPVEALAAADEAGPGCLSFAVAPAYLAKAAAAGAPAVILPPALARADEGRTVKARLVFAEPRLAFTIILGLVAPEEAQPDGQAFFVDRSSVVLGPEVSLGQGAYIGRGVKIGRGSRIEPLAYVEDGVEIGADCRIHPRAVLRRGVRLGDRCIVHSGAVLGGDGFGYTQVPWPAGGRLLHVKNDHRGGVLVEDDVEIGANATIDRGLVADTFIGRGSKIDNLVQIGHNCRIGRDCIIVSQTGVAGHSQVGDRVFMLGQTGLGPGVVLGDDLVLSAQSGVPSGKLPAGRRVWMGTPAKPMEDFQQTAALAYSQLPKLRRFFQLLKKSVSYNDLKEAFFAPPEKDPKKEAND